MLTKEDVDNFLKITVDKDDVQLVNKVLGELFSIIENQEYLIEELRWERLMHWQEILHCHASSTSDFESHERNSMHAQSHFYSYKEHFERIADELRRRAKKMKAKLEEKKQERLKSSDGKATLISSKIEQGIPFWRDIADTHDLRAH